MKEFLFLCKFHDSGHRVGHNIFEEYFFMSSNWDALLTLSNLSDRITTMVDHRLKTFQKRPITVAPETPRKNYAQQLALDQQILHHQATS